MIELPKKIAIRDIPSKGRGVVATKKIKAGEIIEVAPVLIFTKDQYEEKAPLKDYVFFWPDPANPLYYCVVGLGYASIYNYSPQPNAEIQQDFQEETLIFIATKNIKRGEEIVIDYVCDPWFEVID